MNEHPLLCPVCEFSLPDDGAMCNRCGALLRVENGVPFQTGQICFECGHETEAPFDPCPKCGAKTGIECDHCGALNAVRATACAACGKSLDRAAKPPVRPVAMRSAMHLPILLMTAAIVGAFAGLGYLTDEFMKYRQQAVFLFVLVIAGLLAAAFWLTRGQRSGRPKSAEGGNAPGEGMAEVFRSYDITRAEYLLGILQSEGVEAVMMNRHFGSFFPFTMKNGFQVFVPSDQSKRALEILKAYSIDNGASG